MAVERLTDYTRRIWTGLGPDAPEGHDIHVNDVIYYMDSSECCIVTNVHPDGSIDCETLPDVGGGGGDDGEYIGDCFDVRCGFVTSGPNNVSNTASAGGYLRNLAGLPAAGTSAVAWTSVGDPGGWVYDEIVGTNYQANTCYRYRNGAFTGVKITPTYSAVLPEGKQYLVVTYYSKGAPSV